MENEDEESTSTPPNQALGSLIHELHLSSSNQQSEKRSRPESPAPLRSYVPLQPVKRSKKTNPSSPSFPPIFPQEVIVEILAYLPVVSLLRFRCVSKSWKSLISDPFFIKKQLKRTQNDPKFTKKRILINTGTELGIKSCSLKAMYEDPVVNFTELEYPSKGSRQDWIVGSCNGLICIAIGQDTVFLLNPTLRVYKKLPDIGFKKRSGSYTVYGFGCDASMGDYKVVRVFCFPCKGFENSYESIVRVYSLRTKSWRRLQDFPIGVPCNEAGIHVEGSLIWPVFRAQNMGSSSTIVSLDLAQETYSEMQLPVFGDNVDESTYGVLDGCFCLLLNYGRMYADIWVMREFGKRESWTKLFTVPYIPPNVPVPEAQSYSTPLFVSESGEVLLSFGEKFIIYNSIDKTFRICLFQDDSITYIDEVKIYVESLVSPTGVDQHGQQG